MLASEDKIRVGISTCLLGVNVRHDGGHKKDSYILGTLDDFFDWIPVCPEMDVGMGVPREPVRLVGKPDAPRMIGVKSGEDWTKRMNDYSRERVRALKKEVMHGYVLKSKSPSCGMERVKLYSEKGIPTKTGVGLYARALMDGLPHLPVEEEGRLHDARLRESFIIRVFSHFRWHQLLKEGFTAKRLVEFHTRHKFLLMAHSEKHLRELGRLVGNTRALPPAQLRDTYGTLFFEALALRATKRRHVNVLQHIAGFFKKSLPDGDRREMEQAIADYRQGLVPLIVPLTLIRHHARREGVDYVDDQVYLYPHPKEFMLLNHV